MAGIKTTMFSGRLPRVPESLLPPSNAAAASNCDFAYGELRNMKGDFELTRLRNSAASLYTEDGLLFYSWDEDVDAARSPLASDPFDRLYYTTPADFRVTTRSGTSLDGGPPGSSYRVGVPAPLTAPVLTAAPTASLEGATITATFHYEYAGTKYQQQNMTLTTQLATKKWTFLVPARAAKTPEQAAPVLYLTAKDASGTTIFAIYSMNSAFTENTQWRLTISGDSAPTYVADLDVSFAEADQQTTAVVYTYVNTYNEEGPPSPVASITTAELANIVAQVQRDAQLADYAPIKEIRLYRTAPGAVIPQYFFSTSISVLTQAGTTFTVTDKTDAASLNEELSSENSFPPNPNLVGLMLLPNGILCARLGNQLHFCEAYRPWAWNPANVKTFKHRLVGGIVHGSGALITSTVGSFFISGVSPDSMTESETGAEQGGLTKWSLARVGGALVYASNDGLVVVDGGRASMAPSERFFTRDKWRELYRAGFSTMRFGAWDGRLIVFASDNSFVPFLIRFDEAAGSMTDLPALVASYAFTSPLSDQCYLVKNRVLYQFAGGDDLPTYWKSREIIEPAPVNFGIAIARCSGSWTLRIYALVDDHGDDMELVHTEELVSGEEFRMRGDFTSCRWQVQLDGTGRLRELRIADTAAELRRL